ncbi:hypothetical protein [Lysobacter arvi]|uniref:Uncharacterized protein n=1 Tax=Lysobacter arvi TaxID=3038776 RepID=A0ABU1CH80_9GAMM|nr:hypothetical protein [Lysobacter arvi]MDR0184309.1 hypothetical protein [Lysobacter arvi]
MRRFLNASFSRVTTVFHAQTIDLEGNIGFGTFFTNLAARPYFKQSDPARNTPCTDLSTARVDKGVFALRSGTCVIFVTYGAAMRRKLDGRFPAGAGR